MKNVTINKQSKLFVIPCGKNGYSCLGFEVLEKRFKALSDEIGYKPVSKMKGTILRYNEYQSLIEFCRKKNIATGWKSNSELIPEFIGKEGKRVEVVTSYGEINRFIIGRSTGFIPCHLEIKKVNSTGGGSVCGYPFKRITFLN